MINDITTRSFDAMNAYQQLQKTTAGANSQDSATGASSDAVSDFSTALESALQGAIGTGKKAEKQSALGLSGSGDVTSIATSVEEAKITLQTVTTIRDRVVQAYQEVMKMSI
ncbi:flagellar hook-basal body protein FliE [Acetobacter orientalis]|uniref:Flagellar hook-basal body complex protein FliE n=2 Tax=Acetobacter TaxID=434 RepID=A0A252B9T8_9PROT|nr:flagellar hook-basal body complex protein FliE [Acetobacter orientalis]MDN6042040.1 flagellar hook-basal body complex protein FliE [Acetobacter sp.]MCP1216613.1 flagellar hook-basal body complex protein FliE [Acetobacter orientalis]MCP1219631.1 flagellar hook-basal body complex protein FliE [Acetobacter orientalis]MCP1222701.1 flagellar hook-basal body complex protein FliE [Acetobacter orientalis]OUI85305.1 flagellar hook-basal body protein FliE [Acetobacter orientalis]